MLFLATVLTDAEGATKYRLVSMHQDVDDPATLKPEIDAELAKAIGKLKNSDVRIANVVVLAPLAGGVAHINTEFEQFGRIVLDAETAPSS